MALNGDLKPDLCDGIIAEVRVRIPVQDCFQATPYVGLINCKEHVH